jgi:hypothetical protein
VETSGRDVPPPIVTFEECNLPPALMDNIKRCKCGREMRRAVICGAWCVSFTAMRAAKFMGGSLRACVGGCAVFEWGGS